MFRFNRKALTRAANTSEGFFICERGMKKKTALQKLRGDKTHSDNKEKEIERVILYSNFVLNEKFKLVKELIDKKCEPFFEKLTSLSPYKKELERNKDVFYNIVYQRIINNAFLMNALEFINKAENKIKSENKDIYQKLIINVALEHFIPIIDEVFEIPNLVLSAFESSSDSLNKQIKHLTREKELLHNQLDRESSEDKRIPKLTVDKIIKEFLTTAEYDKSLLDNKTELSKEIKKWSVDKYHKRPSLKTIKPKLSNSELEFPELINNLKSK